MQPGDVATTYADIEAIGKDHGFTPSVPLEDGIGRFVSWYKRYHGIIWANASDFLHFRNNLKMLIP
jgi:hypothetical protein